MSAQSGALMLIKVGDGADPESFITVGGLRTSHMVLNSQLLNNSNLESGVWQQLLGAGIRSLSISGSGVFTDAASEETMRSHAFTGSIKNYRFMFPNGNFLTAPFHLSAYERSGDYDSEEVYSMVLHSAGTIVFSED